MHKSRVFCQCYSQMVIGEMNGACFSTTSMQSTTCNASIWISSPSTVVPVKLQPVLPRVWLSYAHSSFQVGMTFINACIVLGNPQLKTRHWTWHFSPFALLTGGPALQKGLQMPPSTVLFWIWAFLLHQRRIMLVPPHESSAFAAK